MKAPVISLTKGFYISAFAFYSVFLLAGSLSATTVLPFVNVGEMALAADAAVLAKAQGEYLHVEGAETRVRFRFQVEQTINGDLPVSSAFELESASGFTGDLYFEVGGDMKYEAGHSYLVFLRQTDQAPYWTPMLMAYGIFEKVNLDKKEYLVPVAEGRNIHPYPRPDGRVVEPLQAYEADDLLFLLREMVGGGKNWNGEAFQLPADLNQRLLDITASPGHCNFFNSRWLDFPDDALPVYAEDDGDPTIADYTQRVSEAVALLGNNYNDINLTYAGSTNYAPDCASGGGSAYSAGSGFFTALSGDRWVLVMFDDPCDQIADLIIEITETTFSCEGVLARGGLYGYAPGHMYDGINKNDAAFGYVVVNEQAGDCLLGSTVDYEYLLAHEITHSLGFNHISASEGVANMNPICCNDITSLDIQCSEYYYGGAIVPVELMQFNIRKEEDRLRLEWQTAWEANNSRFVVERSADGLRFHVIGAVPSAGDADFTQTYLFLDKSPLPGLNYYRLVQVDYDGSTTYSELLSYFWNSGNLTLSLLPNPLATRESLTIYAGAPQMGALEIKLYDLNGRELKRQIFPLEKGENHLPFTLAEFPAGVYLVRGAWGGQAVCRRLVIQ